MLLQIPMKRQSRRSSLKTQCKLHFLSLSGRILHLRKVIIFSSVLIPTSSRVTYVLHPRHYKWLLIWRCKVLPNDVAIASDPASISLEPLLDTTVMHQWSGLSEMNTFNYLCAGGLTVALRTSGYSQQLRTIRASTSTEFFSLQELEYTENVPVCMFVCRVCIWVVCMCFVEVLTWHSKESRDHHLKWWLWTSSPKLLVKTNFN